MKTCEDCGCRVYEYGCVNCNESDYIEMQGEYDEVEMACRGCFGPCGRCHELDATVDAVDPQVPNPGKPPTRV